MTGKIKRWMQAIEFRYFSEKKLCGLIIRMALLMALPVLYIGKYNHMSGDCYWYAWPVHGAWRNTHNLITVWEHSMETIAHYYKNWQGTFTSLFFFTISPGAFGEQYAAVVPYMMIGMICVSTYLFFYALLRKTLKFSRYSFLAIATIAAMMQFEFAHAPSSALYWYNGAVHYVFMQGFVYLMTAFSCLFFNAVTERRTKMSIIWLILLCFAAFMASGANFTTTLLGVEVALVLTLAMVVCWFRKRQKGYWLYTVSLLISVTGFLFNVGAPGNAIRQELYENKSVWNTIMLSFSYSASQMVGWITIYVVVLLILLLPFILKAVDKTAFQFPCPIVFVAMLYCLYASMFAPGFYALGQTPFDRNQNICKMFLMISLVLCEIYVSGWLVKKVKFVKKAVPAHNRNLWPWTALLGAGFILCLCCFLSSDLGDKKKDFVTYAAWDVIGTGDGAQWHKEYLMRLNEYVNNPDDVIYVQPYTSYVYPLWEYQWTEISPSEDGLLDSNVARWYGKTAIYEIKETGEAGDGL